MLSHIVAMSLNRVIGAGNNLPWHIPEDLKYFKDKTKGRIIIMGRKTYESIGRPLPNRLNVVVTRQKDYLAPEAVVLPDISDAIAYAKTQVEKWHPEIFIVGGGEIFSKTLDQVDRIYLTLIEKEFTGDAFYPVFDENDFELIEKSDRFDPIPFSFLVYDRKR